MMERCIAFTVEVEEELIEGEERRIAVLNLYPAFAGNDDAD